jgi:uncharacterized protein (TIGR02145 family)
MMFRILALLLLPVICLAQVNSNGEKPTGELLSNEISPNEMKRNVSFNLDEIKVRWKKAALENCTGVPCVVTPPAPSFTCGTSTVSDIDNNPYETVLIGSQCWTKENLKVTKYNDGTDIPEVNSAGTWDNTIVTGARTVNVDVGVAGYVGTYGYLYNWFAVADARKLCPAGWHVPTDGEWTSLIQFIVPTETLYLFPGYQSTTAGGKLKSNSSLWNNPNTLYNSSGFTALPGGTRNPLFTFVSIRFNAFFWSATEGVGDASWYRSLSTYTLQVERTLNLKYVGNSVRCLKD